jgi:hypothetical protein
MGYQRDVRFPLDSDRIADILEVRFVPILLQKSVEGFREQ